MKSPIELSEKLARQWHNADIREQRLLSADAWPVKLPIGKPASHILLEKPQQIRTHLQRWRSIKTGTVEWQRTNYRAASEALEIPRYWLLHNPSEWITACRDPDIEREFQHMATVVQAVNPQFHKLLIRQRQQLMVRPSAEVIQATAVAMALEPGCAKGKPLRALSVAGCDSKFFERNRYLVSQLLTLRFGDQLRDQSLECFLNAQDESDHWLLVAPLDDKLLPFEQQRVRANELTNTPLPGKRILVVENERSLYQLPPLPETVAILGAGLNLNWLCAEWLKDRQVGYWGDIDSWGLLMLARARNTLPTITPLLMDRTTFDRHKKTNAVPEPETAGSISPSGLNAPEQQLYQHLLTQSQGRLEQEFLPIETAVNAIIVWHKQVKS